MLAVEIKNLKKVYQFGEQEINALNGINFTVEKGEIAAVVGESGSGKSTLLHILGTLDSPSSGDILIDGKNPFTKNDKTVSSFRNLHIGFIFQHNNLLPEFNALENIMMPGLIAGIQEKKLRIKAEGLIEAVGLTKRIKHFPSQLSGGEQQRVAIARAIANKPEIIFADEPTGNLDTENSNRIMELLISLQKESGFTIIMVTHNAEIGAMGDIQLKMQDGILL